MYLQESLEMKRDGVDSWDTVYDVCVTAEYIPNTETDSYSEFCRVLFSKVEIDHIMSDYSVCVLWDDLIEKNMKLFDEFATKYWMYEYEDKDEYIFQWITELHNYCAGNVPESYYPKLLEFVKKLEA